MGLRNGNNQSEQDQLYGRISPDIKKTLACQTNYFQHLTFSEVAKLNGIESTKDYTVFTVVRNPWDRMVSCYRNMDPNMVSVALESSIELANMTFADFVEATESLEHTHLTPQHEFISQSNGRSIDRVFKFEALDELRQFMSDEVGVVNPMPRLHSSTRESSYRNYYDEVLVQAVASRYKEDIEMFNYEF